MINHGGGGGVMVLITPGYFFLLVLLLVGDQRAEYHYPGGVFLGPRVQNQP